MKHHGAADSSSCPKNQNRISIRLDCGDEKAVLVAKVLILVNLCIGS